MNQIVDTETAKEFMKETLGKVSADELKRISDDLVQKSAFFQNRLAKERIHEATEQDWEQIVRSIFATRRNGRKLLELTGVENFGRWATDLLHGDQPVEIRFDLFCTRMNCLEEHLRHDLASELLHFTFPDRYWLWSYWMWNKKTRTGSLPLVITEDFDLDADTPGQSYLKIGRAVAFVHETGEAAGFQNISRSLFGTDVYLSCVYVIYAYTVLKMRMTQEFNKVMPGLPEFSRRLLGVHRIENDAPAGVHFLPTT
jgi:hypothetical protein